MFAMLRTNASIVCWYGLIVWWSWSWSLYMSACTVVALIKLVWISWKCSCD